MEGVDVAWVPFGVGSVRVFDRRSEPVRCVRCCEGERPINVSYGASDQLRFYVTVADSTTIQRVELDVPGLLLYSRQD